MAETTKQNFLEKIPPQSQDAEMAVIGSILLDNYSYHPASEYVTPEMFYKRSHQEIFQAMKNLSLRGAAIDIITLTEELRRLGFSQSAGGPAYLTEIMDKVHTAANIENYSKLVLEKYILRQLISVSNEVTAKCYASEKETRDILDEAERMIFQISEQGVRKDFIPISESAKKTFEKIEKYRQDRSLISGLPTPFFELNALTSGFQNSDLIIIAGRPSMGKTAMALNIAVHMAVQEKIPVGIFSLEMSNDQLAMRLLCGESHVSFHGIRTGYMSDTDYQKLAVAVQYLSKAPIYTDDSPSLTTMELRSKARRLKSEKNIGCLFIDYLQLVTVGERTESRQQQISMISANLKALAKELNIPVVALSQLSRAPESRGRMDKRPMLSDLRESGSIEQDADVVLLLYRPDYYEGKESDRAGTAEVNLAKQRNGPTDVIELAFIKEYTRFENLAPASE